jgi:phosphoglucomutase
MYLMPQWRRSGCRSAPQGSGSAFKNTFNEADSIVITPSHNPPDEGGFKYNPPNGGPAEEQVTRWVEARANHLLEGGLRGVRRTSFEKALRAATTHHLDQVLDMHAIRSANIRMGVDPPGGAGVHYWAPIAERYGLDLTVVNEVVDPIFRFMTLDWDGQVRTDPSSPYAMRRLIGLKDWAPHCPRARHESRARA